MRTIEAMAAQLNARTVVEEVREVLRIKDPEFVAAEERFRRAAAELSSRIGITSLAELIAAWDQACCSDLIYAGYLGFQANLQNFHNPVASQFTRLDYETFLREHIMQTLPNRSAAESKLQALQTHFATELEDLDDDIRSYYIHLEVTGPKLAHYWGYRFANQFLPWVEPGYVSDGAQTSLYALELHRDLGFCVD